jgi:hypothetical protein
MHLGPFDELCRSARDRLIAALTATVGDVEATPGAAFAGAG